MRVIERCGISSPKRLQLLSITFIASLVVSISGSSVLAQPSQGNDFRPGPRVFVLLHDSSNRAPVRLAELNLSTGEYRVSGPIQARTASGLDARGVALSQDSVYEAQESYVLLPFRPYPSIGGHDLIPSPDGNRLILVGNGGWFYWSRVWIIDPASRNVLAVIPKLWGTPLIRFSVDGCRFWVPV